ncbi:MAG TPA: isochorismate synthase [Acidimicrobiales bacterium]|nr:isochorismate synthase [Acidimicrobiales bacterium]
MKYVRRRIDAPDKAALRALAAREGWLLESPDFLRASFGGASLSIALGEGLTQNTRASAALRDIDLEGDEGPPGSGVVAFATLPFDRLAPGQLHVPRYVVTVERAGAAWISALEGDEGWRSLLDNVGEVIQEPQSLRSLTLQPTPEQYAHHVALAVELLRRKEIDKVVLARAVLGSVPEEIDPAALNARLRVREPICTLYSLPTEDGRRFVGASPELLVRRDGALVQCHPLAGTISLPANVAPDDYQNWLLGSTKNLHEHGVLVDEVVRNLSRRYDDIVADAQPSIVTLRTVAHLGTRITATSHEVHPPDALDVLRLLHPTAAVGGIPRERAEELIRELEAHDRGHYGGPLGWIDANGDGEWWIGIRGVLVDGVNFEAWAGAGIVSESDPIAEREETRDKLQSVLSSLLVERF